MASIPAIPHETGVDCLIVMATSTGGPQALSRVLSAMPVLPKTACCVVQHMPAGFTQNLAARLNQLSHWEVEEARDGEALSAGHVYVAPGGFQMTLRRDAAADVRLAVTPGMPVGGHCPSADVLFVSAAGVWSRHLIGVIMTGMGKDGARGLAVIRESGGYTIAQDEESCVVYGMPKAAVALNAVMESVPLEHIHDTISQQCLIQKRR